mgnify:CR=1 FL=1
MRLVVGIVAVILIALFGSATAGLSPILADWGWISGKTLFQGTATSAMDEGRLAEAIAEGTRAERQFDELKEEFRNQTSSRFDEAVRDLRDQARELTEKQQQLEHAMVS